MDLRLNCFSGILYLHLSQRAKEADDFKKLLSGYPASVRAMLGINLDYITSFLGFYAMIFSFAFFNESDPAAHFLYLSKDV